MKKKYWIFIIFILIYLVVILPLTIRGIIVIGIEEGVPDLTYLIPIYSYFFDSIFLYYISPLIMILIINFLSVGLSVLFFKLHNILKIKRYEYFLLSHIDDENPSIWIILRRAIVLGLFPLSIGLFLAEIIPESIIVSSDIAGTITKIQLVSTTGFFIMPILIIIFEPIWLLRDTRVMCKRSTIRKERRELPDIEGVYNYFESNVTGYIGIGAIISLIVILFDSIANLDPETEELSDIPGIILTPLLFIIFTFPIIISHEQFLPKLREKLIARLKRMGIPLVEELESKTELIE